MKAASKRKSGITLAEMAVASAMFALLMLVAVGTMRVVKRTTEHLRGRSLPRQQLRALFTFLQGEVRAATFVYDLNQVVDFGAGFTHLYPGGPPSDPNLPPTNSLLLAGPESPDINPSYRVCGLFMQRQSDGQAAYDGSHRVVAVQVRNLFGATPGSPADIPMAGFAPADTSVKTFQTASPGDGMKVRLSNTEDGLQFEFVIGHETEGEGLVFETYSTHLTMRNNR